MLDIKQNYYTNSEIILPTKATQTKSQSQQHMLLKIYIMDFSVVELLYMRCFMQFGTIFMI